VAGGLVGGTADGVPFCGWVLAPWTNCPAGGGCISYPATRVKDTIPVFVMKRRGPTPSVGPPHPPAPAPPSPEQHPFNTRRQSCPPARSGAIQIKSMGAGHRWEIGFFEIVWILETHCRNLRDIQYRGTEQQSTVVRSMV